MKTTFYRCLIDDGSCEEWEFDDNDNPINPESKKFSIYEDERGEFGISPDAKRGIRAVCYELLEELNLIELKTQSKTSKANNKK